MNGKSEESVEYFHGRFSGFVVLSPYINVINLDKTYVEYIYMNVGRKIAESHSSIEIFSTRKLWFFSIRAMTILDFLWPTYSEVITSIVYLLFLENSFVCASERSELFSDHRIQ